MRRLIGAAVIAAISIGGLTACTSDADRVRQNINTEADQFKVQRRITFINGITDRYMLTIEGLCSFDRDGGQLTVLCETGPGRYVKDTLGLADNVTYIVEQADENASSVSKYHYKVVLKPENALPSFDVELGGAQ